MMDEAVWLTIQLRNGDDLSKEYMRCIMKKWLQHLQLRDLDNCRAFAMGDADMFVWMNPTISHK